MLPIVPIVLLALGGVAVAKGAKKHAAQSVTLDSHLPATVEAQVLGLLKTSHDPAELTAHALQLQINYPLSSKALLARAAALSAPHAAAVAHSLATGTPPAAAPTTQPSTQAPGVPPTSLPQLDATIDADTAHAVITALTVETDPAALLAFAHAIQDKYPQASGALTLKAASLVAAKHAADAASVPVAPADQSKITAVETDGVTTKGAGGVLPLLLLGGGALAAILFSQKKAHAATTTPDGRPSVTPTTSTPGVLTMPDTTIVAAVPASPISTPPPTQAPTPMPQDLGAAAAPPANAPEPSPKPTPASATPATTPEASPKAAAAGGTWVIAADQDVSRDGTAATYAAMISQPVGAEKSGTFNGRTWKFRVVSAETDPDLTDFSKDVKGWIWQPAGAPPIARAAMAAPPVLVPVVTSHTLASVPPSSSVLATQQKLNKLAIVSPLLAEDGIQGPKTIAATKTFQSTHGLAVDGIAGPKTQAALDAAIAALGSAPVVQRPGTAPGAVNVPPTTVHATVTMTLTQVQHALNVLGFPDDSGAALVEDGKLGPKTISAVKRFQGASGLVVDGKPGPMTQAELGAQLAAQANPSQAASGTSTGFLGGNPWRYVA